MNDLGDDHGIKPLVRPVLGVRDKAEFLNAFKIKSKATSGVLIKVQELRSPTEVGWRQAAAQGVRAKVILRVGVCVKLG